jgi:hypothetical protein
MASLGRAERAGFVGMKESYGSTATLTIETRIPNITTMGVSFSGQEPA